MPRQHADQLIGWNGVNVVLQIFRIFRADLMLLFCKATKRLADSLHPVGRPLKTNLVLVIFGDGAIVGGGKPAFRRIENPRKLVERNKACPPVSIVSS